MQKAKRFSPEQRYSFILNVSKARAKPYKVSLTLHQVHMSLGIFIALSIFSVGSALVYHQMQPVMDKYKEVITSNNTQKRQIFALLEKNKTMQDSSHQLMSEDRFLRKKLYLGEKNKNVVKPNAVPVISVNLKAELDGEVAEIIIDDKVVLSLFDNSAAPTVKERAMEVADNIRNVYAHQSPYHRFTFQGDRDNNYQVYYNGLKVFEVGDMESSYFRSSSRQLTKKWIENLAVALEMKTEPLFVLQVRNILNSFHNPKKFEPVYTDIDYVSGKKIVSEYTTEPEIHKIDQLVAFLQGELKKRTESYNSLRNVIKEYKIRFAKTPSIIPVYSHSISGFGRRIHPITGKIRFHAGVDLPAPEGTPVRKCSMVMGCLRCMLIIRPWRWSWEKMYVRDRLFLIAVAQVGPLARMCITRCVCGVARLIPTSI